MRMFKTIFIWLWYEWTRSTEFLVPWMRTLSLCFFIICAWNEVFKGDLASTSFMHLFLASGGYNLNPWQNIKHWLSMCMHGVWVTGSVYVWVCFNMFFQPAVNESFTLCVTVDAHVYTCVFPLCACVCALVQVCVTAAITYSSLHFSYSVTVHFNGPSTHIN